MAAAETVIFRARYLLPIIGPCIENGALVVRNGRIDEIGDARRLAASHPAWQVVDFGDALLLPPMANAHTHLELTHIPYWDAFGAQKEVPGFTAWLLRLIGVLRGVPPEEFSVSLQDGIRQVLNSGTGAVGDILSRIYARQAYRHCPLRGRIFLEALGTDRHRNKRTLECLKKALDEKAPGAMTFGLAPHSLYTLSTEFLQGLTGLAARLHLPQSMHVAESPEESLFVQDAAGPFVEHLYPRIGWGDRVPPGRELSPAGRMARLKLLSPGDLLVHGVQVSNADIDILAGMGVYVVLCPRSNHRLKVGKAPVSAYLNAGVPLLLGTDSLASNDSLSLWDEMAFAHQCYGEDLDPGTLLGMATYQGARALGLGGEMGALAPGYGAHFQVLKPADLPAIRDIESFLCRPGRTAEVQALYLDGKPCNP
jgi:cytosine/adenosine deaminase-related metal-dependent hydrolase